MRTSSSHLIRVPVNRPPLFPISPAAVWYIFMTQVLYTILIRILGYETLPLPRFVSRALNV